MEKIELKIKTLGEAVLRKRAKPVSEIDDYRRKVLSEMSRFMYSAKGVGLAAPQVGISEAMIVIDIGAGLYKLINPEIVKKEGSQINEEGCLSIPGVNIKVRRAKNVVIQAQDESGKPVTINAEGLLACVFQHEIDHLNGKLIIDYISALERKKLRQ